MRLTRLTLTGSLLATALAAGRGYADEILLRGGGRLNGVVVERTETHVTIETGPGRVTLPASRVVRVVEGRSALEEFSERAAAIAPGDAPAWAALARWAEARSLLTQARHAWQQVLGADPGNAEANAALGRVSLDGEWMSAEEAYRARGFVSYGGRWVTPAEHEAAIREEAAAQAAALELREADLRVREAEARAREAEARAREAEYAADQSGGIPLDYAYGGYAYGYPYGAGAVVAPLPGPYPPAGHPRKEWRGHPHRGHQDSTGPTPTPTRQPSLAAPDSPPQRRSAGVSVPRSQPASQPTEPRRRSASR